MSFKTHVFISYAHADNLEAGGPGWVTRFHEFLEPILTSRLKRKKAVIWRDKRLSDNDDFDPVIMEQLPGTAIFVAVLTDNYVFSDWCRREAEAFCKLAAQGVGLAPEHKSRVFKILKLPPERQDTLPEPMQKILGMPFFVRVDKDRRETQDEQDLPLELDPSFGEEYEARFRQKITFLAQDIANTLKAIDATSTAGASPLAVSGAAKKPTVYLAQGGEDRRIDREALRSELVQGGYPVLPESELPDGEIDLRAEVARLLERSALSVHLLGATGGMTPDGGDDSIVAIQNALAVERERAGRLRRVVWLPAGTEAKKPAHQQFLQAMQVSPEVQGKAELITADIGKVKEVMKHALDDLEKAAATTKPAVYLALCSYDRSADREALRSQLVEGGYVVLPEKDPPLSDGPFQAEVAQVLEGAALSVHLLGASGGVTPEDSDIPLVEIQNELAAKRERAGLRRVVWLPTGTVARKAAHRQFLEAMQKKSPDFLGKAELINGDLEKVKAAMLDALKQIESPPPPPVPEAAPAPGTAAQEAPKLYVIFDERDRKATVPLRKSLGARGLTVQTPVFEGDAKEVREANEQRLAGCDAVLVFYGSGTEAWKASVDSDIRKAAALRPGRPLPTVFTWLAEPSNAAKADAIEMGEPNLSNGLRGFSENLVEPIARSLLGPAMVDRTIAVPNPYPGLRPFRTDEEHLFFGRENQVDRMIDKLAARRFLSVVGTSGSGKSSLVNCGLRPALHRGYMVGAGAAWRMAQFRPGSDPIGGLARALAAPGVLFDQPLTGALSTEALVEATLRLGSLGLVDIVDQADLPPGTQFLVVVDQFEELFRFGGLAQANPTDTYGPSAEAGALVRLLLEAKARPQVPIHVVLTMRSDFLGDCSQFQGLPEAINEGQYLVPRLTRNEIRAAITGPAAVAGATLTPVLVTRLLNDVGDNPDQLSILQHALNRTWARWQSDAGGGGQGPVDLPHYEAIGTMANALDQHAERAFAQLTIPRQQQICEKLFKALTDKATDPRGVRRPTTLGTLCGLANATPAEVTAVIDVFRKPSRSFLMPPAGESLEAETVIDISHESLMRVWKLLNTWADEEARSVEMYRLLANAAMRHEAGNASLWRDPDLQLALDWQVINRPNVTWAQRLGGNYETAINFLDQSHKASDAEKAKNETERRQKLRRFQLLATVMALLAGWAWLEKCRGFSREFAARALASLEVDPQQSVSNALRAATLSWNLWPVPEASDALRQALFESHLRLNLTGHTGAVTRAVFSPDGRLIASASEDHTVRLWDVTSGHQVAVLMGHSATVNDVEFSPDGRLLVTAGLDGQTIVSETNSARPLNPLPSVNTNMPSNVRSASFSPDGRVVVAATDDGLVRLWDYRTGTVLNLTGHTNKVHQAVFSPDGQTVLTASEDFTARIWDAHTGQNRVVLTNRLGHSDSVVNAAFSPGGSLVTTASSDGTAIIWRTNGDLVAVIQHFRNQRVESARFSPDGRAVVTACLDGTARLWWTNNLVEAVPLLGHIGHVFDARFSPDGEYVVTAGVDNTARLWATDGTPVATFRGHGDELNSASFSPSDPYVVTASKDKSVRVWEVPGWRPARLGTSEVFTAQISPNARWIAIAGAKGPVQLWHCNPGAPLVWTAQAPPLPDTNYVSTLAFSLDSHRLLCASQSKNSRSVRVFNVDTTELEKFFLTASGVRDAAFSPDNRLIAIANAGDRNAALLWDWRSNDTPSDLAKGGTNVIMRVAFNPDGRQLLLASENRLAGRWDVQVLRTNDGTSVALLAETLEKVQAVAFHPKGDRIVIACSDGTLRIWKLPNQTSSPPLAGHAESVNCAQFSPDGRFVVSAGGDKTVRIWAADTRTCLAILRGHTDYVKVAGFSPDGRTVVSVARDGRVITWATEECVPQADLLSLAAQRLRHLSAP